MYSSILENPGNLRSAICLWNEVKNGEENNSVPLLSLLDVWEQKVFEHTMLLDKNDSGVMDKARKARNALENLKPNDSVVVAARATIESMEECTEKINGYTMHISSLINETNRTLEKISAVSEAHTAVPRVGSTGRG